MLAAVGHGSIKKKTRSHLAALDVLPLTQRRPDLRVGDNGKWLCYWQRSGKTAVGISNEVLGSAGTRHGIKTHH